MTKRTILVVEDDAALRETMAFVLADEGFHVVAVDHGARALDWLAASPAPAVILLDLMMPVLDGWSFLERRDAALSEVPVVVVTASPDVPRGVSFLQKPVDLELLVAAVTRCAGGRGRPERPGGST